MRPGTCCWLSLSRSVLYAFETALKASDHFGGTVSGCVRGVSIFDYTGRILYSAYGTAYASRVEQSTSRAPDSIPGHRNDPFFLLEEPALQDGR
jgi:hypothetical protein